MSSVIGSLRVSLGIDSAQFSRGAKQAQGDMQRLGREMQKIGAAVSAIGAGIAVALRGSLNAADQMGKAAQSIGLPVEALSQLRYAADLSGVSVGQLEGGMRRLAQSMTQRAGDFAALGIAVRDADGVMRPTVDVLNDFSDALATMPDGAEKTALVMKFLGRDAAALIPMLNGGSEALRRMMKEADDLGKTISGETAQAAARFNDAMTKLRATASGLAAQIAAELAPMMASIAETVANLAAGFAKLSDTGRTFAATLAAITVAAGPVLVAVGTLVRSLGALRLAFAALGGPIGIAAALIGAAAVAMLGFRRNAEGQKQPLDEARVAVNLLNEAMGTFSSAASPSAQAAALNNATAYRSQAAAALQAAEAEVALMEAELARFRSAPAEQRGLMGDMEEGAMTRNIAAAQAEIDSMRASLDLARVRIRQAAGEITSSMGPAMIEGSEATARLKLELEGVEGVLGRIGGGGGSAGSIPGLKNGLGEIQSQASITSNVFTRLGEGLSSAFADMATGARSMGDSLRALARDILRMVTNEAMMNLFTTLRGSMRPDGAGLLKGLVGSFGGFRAAGGPVSAGRSYVVGEKRPELFVPRQSGTILPAVPGGGGGTQIVNIVNNSPETVTETRRRGPSGEQILDVTIGQSIGGGRQDAAMGRFGMVPRVTKR